MKLASQNVLYVYTPRCESRYARGKEGREGGDGRERREEGVLI